MSMQFGIWRFDGTPPSLDFLDNVDVLMAPYGPGSGTRWVNREVAMLYRAFLTVSECRPAAQPYLTPSGLTITWDGRLDNRSEVIRLLSAEHLSETADVVIVATVYERWGTDCFARLLGDWALAIWNPNEPGLILAKDFMGIRHLYYSVESERVTWSTILDPLLVLADRQFDLNEEYIAGWFYLFPATHLTPYQGIHAVPPSSFVLIKPGSSSTSKYWDFDGDKRIRYRTDAEYEEHFRALFAQCVQRRLRADAPILAELSGGVDSSSIVCVADTLIDAAVTETPRLDTVSYYNDSEPHWNEGPYFSLVEQKRGRTGNHIDTGSQNPLDFRFDSARFAATPSCGTRLTEAARQFAECFESGSIRVLLSGFGGDEVTGGVPTPMPELADLMAKARFGELAHQLKVWALEKRKPWFHLLGEVMGRFLPPTFIPREGTQPPAWLESDFAKSYQLALTGYERRLTLVGPPPSFQENLGALEVLRRQLGCFVPLPSEPPYEDALSLSRSRLAGISLRNSKRTTRSPGSASIADPQGLNRNRPRRGPEQETKGICCEGCNSRNRKKLPVAERNRDLTTDMISAQLGILDADAFRKALQAARRGGEVPIVPLARGLLIESWLKNLVPHQRVALPAAYSLARTKRRRQRAVEAASV